MNAWKWNTANHLGFIGHFWASVQFYSDCTKTIFPVLDSWQLQAPDRSCQKHKKTAADKDKNKQTFICLPTGSLLTTQQSCSLLQTAAHTMKPFSASHLADLWCITTDQTGQKEEQLLSFHIQQMHVFLTLCPLRKRSTESIIQSYSTEVDQVQ